MYLTHGPIIIFEENCCWACLVLTAMHLHLNLCGLEWSWNTSRTLWLASPWEILGHFMCSLPLLCVCMCYIPTYLAASIKILTSLEENTTRVTRYCFYVRIYNCTVCIMAQSIYLTCFNFNTFKSVIFKRKLVCFYAILTFPRYCPYQLRNKCSKETTFNNLKVLPGSTMLICS